MSTTVKSTQKKFVARKFNIFDNTERVLVNNFKFQNAVSTIIRSATAEDYKGVFFATFITKLSEDGLITNKC